MRGENRRERLRLLSAPATGATAPKIFRSCVAMLLAAIMAVPAARAMAQEAVSPAINAPAQFEQTCALCHGDDAQGSDRAPALLGNRQLRGLSESDVADIIQKGRGNMPAFSSLPAADVQQLAHFVRALNASAFDMKPAGDTTAGSSIFFGSGQCAQCHTAEGRGGTNGPDLSDSGRRLTLRELTADLQHPEALHVPGYDMQKVTLRDGTTLRGFARRRSSHSIDLQTLDGRLHLLDESQYSQIVADTQPYMPAFNGTADQYRDLIAYLSSLNGVHVGPITTAQGAVPAEAIRAVVHPNPADWPTYSGDVRGDRHSALRLIDTHNVASLRPAWAHPLPYDPLETTPVVMDGVMYVTGPNQVYALDGRTGGEIWRYSRPRSAAATISGDAAKGAQRGVALLGDRVFFITDNAHLICLQRLTGALLWDVAMPEGAGKYGGTSAPLIAGDLVIAGVSGGDEGVRGFVAAYRAMTGEQAWRFWTVPKADEPAAASWQGDPDPQGGTTWTTPSYDPETGVLYVGVGNPYPDTDGDNRGGDNLYTDSDVALDAKSGKLLWYFQFTPHDVHDWDADQPIALVDAPFEGQQRKLLLHANRNGFFYVLDRTNGKLLRASAFVRKLTWASGIGPDGRPVLLPANETTLGGAKTCPAVRGATNWYSTSFDPTTGLYYVMAVEDCSLYRKAHDGGYGAVNDPIDPAHKVLRALAVDTGKIAWELPLLGRTEANYSGVLTTASGLLFFGESNGEFAALDAKSGKYLWHFEANQVWKASPITYEIDGREYIAIASGPNILSFTTAH
jgi:PQQ-dependent dehydrogenase (methanol/ethanol family)